MDGRNRRPPDEGGLNEAPPQNGESNFNGIEVKQEPTVKIEPTDALDMLIVSVSEHAATGSYVNSMTGEQTSATDDFIGVGDLVDVEPMVKKESIDEQADKGSPGNLDKGAVESKSSNDSKDLDSNGNQSKMKQRSVVSKKIKSNLGETSKNHKVGGLSNKNKSPASNGNGKQHKCPSCEYSTKIKSHFNVHIRKHTGERPFSCTHCVKRFTQKPHLQSHMRMHVSEFLFNCSNCLKGFNKCGEKVKHEINCKVRRYECDVCKKYFTFQKMSLVIHMRAHNGERPFQCNHCAKKFTRQGHLKGHMKTHTKTRPVKFQCSICYRNFSQRIEKEEHEAKCKRRGYECYVCKEFTTSLQMNLRQHMRIHTGERPFQCKLCQKSFTQKQNLKIHQNCIHK